MNGIDAILEGLITRTTESQLTWDRSANTDEFVTTVGDVAITIRRVANAGLISSERFLLRIVDDEGSNVESLESAGGMSGLIHVPSERRATVEQGSKLNELFLLARRSALDVQNTIDKLLSDLASP